MSNVVANRSSVLRRFVAMMAVALVVMLDVLAVCPEAHEFFHHDAGHEDHECVVTQFLHGSTTPFDFGPLLCEPILVRGDEVQGIVALVLPVAPAFLHPPGCGPPAV